MELPFNEMSYTTFQKKNQFSFPILEHKNPYNKREMD